jgi:hypothetical protein
MAIEALARLNQADQATANQFLELVRKTDKQKPDPADVAALARMLAQHPQLWRFVGDIAELAARNVVEKIEATAPLKESLKRGRLELMHDLGYDQAPPLERGLIEQVALSWLRLNLVEYQYSNVMAESITFERGRYWEQRLTTAQRRYTRAVESLARVRKLTRPALQINVATEGGQQVNVAGHVTPAQTSG